MTNKLVKRDSNNNLIFPDFPLFKPNLTPKQIFQMGSFGGTYWRPIYSSVTNKNYKDIHKKYDNSWWEGLTNEQLTSKWENYNKNLNKYKVKVGTTLEFWEQKNWITKYNPYGWMHWYCDFYIGKRGPDDERQIKRWISTAGPNSRFRKRLINMLNDKKKKYNDFTVSPKIRQTLQHWGYQLTSKDLK